MDATKLGCFIADLRRARGMTQAELARRLHVTDKAVSKWENGRGLPDINSIEPLADALGVSVLEIMRAERTVEDSIGPENTEEALTEALDLAKRQRRAEYRQLTMIFTGTLLSIALFFLFDAVGWAGIIGVVAPCLFLSLSVGTAIHGALRRRRGLPCARFFRCAAICLVIPLLLIGALFLSGLLGVGPVPAR